MDSFSMFKFWKTNKSKRPFDVDGDGDGDTIADSTFSDPLTEFSDDFDDDDDSYFELELTLPKFNTSSTNVTQPANTNPNTNTNSDNFDTKISNSKPQSPISILRSASPKLRIFMFSNFIKKSKSDEVFLENDDVSLKSNSSSPLTVKFKIEDGSIVPKLTSTSIANRSTNMKNDSNSKRFSKDAVQKYLSFVKPLYGKKSGDGDEGRFRVSCSPTRMRKSSSSVSASFSSPTKSGNATTRFKTKTKTKYLGKSKSASARVVLPTPARNNDHPCDGIEGAILHCKRSLDSKTRGQSSLSRCSSDPSHEKSIKVSEEQQQLCRTK